MSTPSTYTLAGPLGAPVAQPSTLLGMGADQQRSAMGLVGASAEAEQRRGLVNQQLEQERKAGNAQLGSTLGSMAGMAYGMSLAGAGAAGGAAAGAAGGSMAGPIGMLIGGALGGILGGRF